MYRPTPLPLASRRLSSCPISCTAQQDQQQQQQQPEKQQLAQQQQQQQNGRHSHFQDMVHRLKLFQQSKGRLPRQTETDADGVRLGWWINTQRMAYRRGKLLAEHITSLEGVPGWAWRVELGSTTSWEDKLHRLRAFQQEEGRLPRQNEADGEGVQLGAWLNTQRIVYRKQQMPADRVAALEGVHGWSWRGKTDVHEVYDWVDTARAFQQAKGHIPKRLDTWDGKNIGKWVQNARAAYWKGGLSQEIIAACEAIPGWVWKERHRRSQSIPFDLGISVLEAFVQAHGRLPVYSEVGGEPSKVHVGHWASYCRARKRKGHLTADQIAALEGVVGWWWDLKNRRRHSL